MLLINRSMKNWILHDIACSLLSLQIYPSGMTDGSLLREPLKDHPLPGEPKTYDSVQVSAELLS